MTMLTTAIGRLRALAIIEGISYLALLLVAMPLKYLAGLPEAVLVVGWIHGVLFVALVLALLIVHLETRWGLRRSTGVMVAALLPFGTFVIDRGLRQEHEEWLRRRSRATEA